MRMGDGPIPARVMLVGEAFGEQEEREGTPFVGPSGMELNRMLHEAGIMRGECYVTNVVNARPPQNDIGRWVAMKKKDISVAHRLLRDKYCLDIVHEGYARLRSEIEMVKPNVIVPMGNLALWALTGHWGINKWRGSLLGGGTEPKVIPTIHPAAVLREWSNRASVVHDLKRVAKHMKTRGYEKPQYNFLIRPSFGGVQACLTQLRERLDAGETLWIDLDIETRNGHIACIGLSWSKTDAVIIPLMCIENNDGYWNLDEEAAIVHMIYQVTTHRNCCVRWQNGLYDAQYIFRHWHFIPRGCQDTMIGHHASFSDLPKSLAYQASIYAEHYVYWKDEGKDWAKGMGEEQLWSYNGLDCVYTRECGESQLETAKALGLEKVHEFQQAMFYPVLWAMNKGVHVIKKNRDELAFEVQEQIEMRENMLQELIGHPINPNSPKQMSTLFYEDFAQQPIMTRATKGNPAHVTCNDEALQKISKREPLLRPIINCISDIRTLGIFLSNFILAPLDADGRMRCSYNIGGSESGKSAPKTYRLSSSKNAFGSGTNLQNIPSEKSKSVGKAKARGSIAFLGDPYELPNVRSLFGPDSGYTFFDMDLDRADIQAMAWDADEPLLKEALRSKVDIHLLNVYLIDGQEPPPFDELREDHPKYPDHRGPRKYKREFAKVFAHATDYLGKPRTVAVATGRTVHEVERAQRMYLGAYKGIASWQQRVIDQVRKRRYVENAFGYRWYIFDRIDDQVMPEAVAWIPQSTVSIVINRIWMAIFLDQPEAEWGALTTDALLARFRNPSYIQVLLQVHDSLAGQFPTHKKEQALARLQELSRIVVPYDDPLIIPTGINTSEISWGYCG